MGRSADAMIFYGCKIAGSGVGPWLEKVAARRSSNEEFEDDLDEGDYENILKMYVSLRDGRPADLEALQAIGWQDLKDLPLEIVANGFDDGDDVCVALKALTQSISWESVQPLNVAHISEGPPAKDLAFLKDFCRVMQVEDKVKIGWFVAVSYG
jgi:hypothetical protein